ncbi:facilitated trehalose transporter Tret1-like isoform X2 [Prorops nasuta]|uniref:facilitated trehalose transporter Tret1-like isoform X2 n=1 Tax=Prorops nasuta TaxID=863751 RepID=UPI0034CEB25E
MSELPETENHTQKSKKLPQFVAVLLATIASFSIGTYLSWTSPALPLYNKNGTLFISDQEGSWICALLPAGAIVGTVPAGILADKFGRKKTICILSVLLLTCWLPISFAQTVNWIYLGRFVAGVSSGAVSVVIPIYASEIADDSIRGALGTIFQLQITIGILYAYISGLIGDVIGMSMFCAAIPALLLMVCPLLPESPVWLIREGRKEEAHYAIRKLRGQYYRTDDELNKLENNLTSQGDRVTFLDLIQYKKALIITLGLMVFQQLSGVNTLIFYAEKIFKTAGSSLSSTISSVIVGIVQVIATYFSTILIDRTGRKFLLFVSASVMSICMFTLSGYFHFQNEHDVSKFAWIPLLSFAVFIIIFSVGFGPIPWLMVGELFTNNAKRYGRHYGDILVLCYIWYDKFVWDLVCHYNGSRDQRENHRGGTN